MALPDGVLPTRENCDPDDPEETFLPAFVALPDVRGAAMILPIPWWRKVSAHLRAFGAMLRCPACGHEETPTIRYKPSLAPDPLLGAAGEWVPADEPEPERDVLAEQLDKLRPHVKKAVFERLAAEHPEWADIKKKEQN